MNKLYNSLKGVIVHAACELHMQRQGDEIIIEPYTSNLFSMNLVESISRKCKYYGFIWHITANRGDGMRMVITPRK